MLLDARNVVDTNDPNKDSIVQAALQEFYLCLRLLESKEQWAHEIRDSFVHRAQNGTLVPKSLEHDPDVQEKLTAFLRGLEANLDAFENVLDKMRKLAQFLVGND